MKYVSLTINGFDVKVAFDENSIHIYNAYPIKDDLKLRGYRWNPENKTWYNNQNDIEKELIVLKNNLKEIREEVKEVKESEEKIESQFPDSKSVSELKNRLQRLILEHIGGNIWVRGVIASNIKNYDWASYFDLRDEDENKDVFFSAEIQKTVLANVNYKLKQKGIADSLEKDLPVLLLVKMSLSYKKNVNVRLNILDVLPDYTREKIKNQREITLDKLKTEGLLYKQKQLELPRLVNKIALISSEQGTSVRDIESGLGKYRNKYDVYFIDARMEGDNAVSSIVSAVDFLENYEEDFDIIIIARGGGSEQSLAVFNDYQLCKRVCLSNTPIITAIGHDKDLSAIELCSYLTPSPSTPSGVGKYLYDSYLATEKNLSELFGKFSDFTSNFIEQHIFKMKQMINSIAIISNNLINSNNNKIIERIKYIFLRMQGKNRVEREKLITIKSRIEPKFVFKNLENSKNNIIDKLQYIFTNGKKIFILKENDLKIMNNLINANNPDRILKRGFTMLFDTDGNVIKKKKDFKKNRAVLKFIDGSVKIKKTEDEDE